MENILRGANIERGKCNLVKVRLMAVCMSLGPGGLLEQAQEKC